MPDGTVGLNLDRRIVGVLSVMSELSPVDQKRIELYLADKRTRVSPEPHSRIPRRSFNSPASLSFSQEHIFHRAEHNTDKPPNYNEYMTVFRTGSLDVQALERSLKEIIRRREIWRTRRTQGIIGRAQYNSEASEDDTITHMLRGLERILEIFSSHPQLRLSDLPDMIERG